MSPEQRKRVAEIVYPSNIWVITNGIVHPYYPVKVTIPPGQFNPDFFGSAEQRSQALAVVQWIAKAIERKFESLMVRSEYSNKLRRAIAEDDIESLLSLVLELSDE